MKKVFLENPDKLEITAAIVRPKREEAKDLAIITIAVYCPPNSKKQSKLIDYVTETYHALKSKHPTAFFILGGDVNSLNWRRICEISPNFKQCVTKPTRKEKTLSVIITDLHMHYEDVKIFPPLEPDKEGDGAASDHKTPYLKVDFCGN